MYEILLTENLKKHYGKVYAVEDVSLDIKKGEIYGFIGLNGAGKTTTIRLLLGMVRPTAGTAYIFGEKVDAGKTEIWRRVGYVVEIPYSYPDLTVKENLEIIRRLRQITDSGSVDKIIERLQLTEYRNRKAKELSHGNAQRLGLAKALLHRPEVLILDEPSNGLDPAGIVEIRELLRDLAFNHGVTIFISSHILGEISKFANRIGIIHEGRLIQEVDTNQLNQLRRKRLLLNALNKEAVRLALINNGYSVNVTEDGILEIKNDKAINHPEAIATMLVQTGLPPTLLRVEEEDLESYFLRTIEMNGVMK